MNEKVTQEGRGAHIVPFCAVTLISFSFYTRAPWHVEIKILLVHTKLMNIDESTEEHSSDMDAGSAPVLVAKLCYYDYYSDVPQYLTLQKLTLRQSEVIFVFQSKLQPDIPRLMFIGIADSRGFLCLIQVSHACCLVSSSSFGSSFLWLLLMSGAIVADFHPLTIRSWLGLATEVSEVLAVAPDSELLFYWKVTWTHFHQVWISLEFRMSFIIYFIMCFRVLDIKVCSDWLQTICLNSITDKKVSFKYFKKWITNMTKIASYEQMLVGINNDREEEMGLWGQFFTSSLWE